MDIIKDAMQASMPGSAKQFLGSVQPKPIGQMIMYLGILAILPLIGYIVGGLIGFGVVYGLIWGIVSVIGLVVAVVGSGFALSMVSESVLGRKVSPEETITLVGYAATPVFVIMFLAGIFQSMWTLAILASLLSLLAWIYMAYLLYVGAGARYGADKALVATIVVLVAGIIVSFIFGAIAGAVTWSMMWGAYVAPAASYYQAAAYSYGF
jgi:hypothetical protein